MLSRKSASVWLFLCLVAVLHAQTESRKDSIPGLGKGKSPVIEKPQRTDSTSATRLGQNVPGANAGNNRASAMGAAESPEKVTYQLPPVSYFPQRLLEDRSTTRFPFANDYSYSGIRILDANSWISGATEHTTLPSFGIIQQTALQYNRIFNNKLILSGGLSGKKLEMHEQQYGDLKANLGLQWLISNRVTMNASGNYSMMRRDGGMGSMMGAFIPSEISGGRTSAIMPLGQAQWGLDYKMTDWLSISGGTYVNQMDLFSRKISDYGLNSRMNLQVNDRLNLRLYGSYSLKGKQSFLNQSPLYPQNSYGGAVEYRISDKFGLGAGVDRYLNPFTGKWVTQPYVYPIFYNDKNEKKSFQIQINGR
ncbi:MAG: hypothetical protein BGN96_09915 [Bacteroidales bacterium 45-6]|nr:MAG: hypothetical protein BGN96_09915 [Bacteroidales bacterium 45-6]